MTPRLASQRIGLFDNVVFCVPPSALGDGYVESAHRALAHWNHRGVFLFTSSTAVYAEANGGDVREHSPTSDSPRAKRLLDVEELVTKSGGKILRLAGLYDETSGPHLTYRRQSESEQRGDGWVNLIHYDDAAQLATLILSVPTEETIFLGCDNHPMTRDEIATIAGAHCRFSGTGADRGRRCFNGETATRLRWVPEIKNLAVFLGKS